MGPEITSTRPNTVVLYVFWLSGPPAAGNQDHGLGLSGPDSSKSGCSKTQTVQNRDGPNSRWSKIHTVQNPYSPKSIRSKIQTDHHRSNIVGLDRSKFIGSCKPFWIRTYSQRSCKKNKRSFKGKNVCIMKYIEHHRQFKRVYFSKERTLSTVYKKTPLAGYIFIIFLKFLHVFTIQKI